MHEFSALFRRNVKLFFKDKGIFFTSLITPLILLVLYATFLGNVFRDSLQGNMPSGVVISEALLNGYVGAQLISSILAVSCVTVAFCSNMLLVQDKVTGALRDFQMTPVSPSVLALSYYCASLASTLLVCYTAAAVCFVYVAAVGWYLSFLDVLLLLWDVLLLSLFGTALSSVIHFFLSNQGQISAVGTIVSSGYGFLCGAYMPLSQFSEGLRRVLSFLPGTYGTALVRNHAMGGVLSAMEKEGIPQEALEGIRDAFDCNIYFFDRLVSPGAMMGVLGGTIVLLIVVYILMNALRQKKH